MRGMRHEGRFLRSWGVFALRNREARSLQSAAAVKSLAKRRSSVNFFKELDDLEAALTRREVALSSSRRGLLLLDVDIVESLLDLVEVLSLLGDGLSELLEFLAILRASVGGLLRPPRCAQNVHPSLPGISTYLLSLVEHRKRGIRRLSTAIICSRSSFLAIEAQFSGPVRWPRRRPNLEFGASGGHADEELRSDGSPVEVCVDVDSVDEAGHGRGTSVQPRCGAAPSSEAPAGSQRDLLKDGGPMSIWGSSKAAAGRVHPTMYIGGRVVCTRSSTT